MAALGTSRDPPGRPEFLRAWASDYFERPIDASAVKRVFRHERLSAQNWSNPSIRKFHLDSFVQTLKKLVTAMPRIIQMASKEPFSRAITNADYGGLERIPGANVHKPHYRSGESSLFSKPEFHFRTTSYK